MRCTGQADLPEHGEEVHYRQPPGEAQNWQDSVVLVWWDETNSVGGFHRLGHEPNAVDGGKVTSWNYLWAPEGIYKKTGYNALRDQDLLPNGGYGNGNDTCQCEFIDGEHVWTIKDPELETSACLRMVDISGNVDCFPKSAAIKSFNTAHFDIPGRVSGWLKVRGREYQITNAHGVRDHGWGPRGWHSFYSHRWVAGTVAQCSANETMMSFGWIVRDNVITFAKNLDIVAYIEIDGATNRGGHLKWTLVTGEVLDIECTVLPIQGVVSYHNDNCVVERLCSWTSGRLKGFCDFETTSNIQKGSRTPKKFTSAIIDNGFWPN
ncbi:hypothetical protein LTR67_011214 [Exophiala xenobiotica]